MKQWVCIMEQSGGCDYTIGCGIAVYYVEAMTKESAWHKILVEMGWDEYDEHPERFDYCWPCEGEMSPDLGVTLIEIASKDHEIYDAWCEVLKRKMRHTQEDKERSKDEEEFERLRQKLGK